MRKLTETEKKEAKFFFAKQIDFTTRNNLEIVHEYIKRVRPFGLNAYVSGISEGNKITGYVEAFYTDGKGNLSMIITTSFKEIEHVLYVDTEDFKTFKEIEIL